jgi:hypothetical protein
VSSPHECSTAIQNYDTTLMDDGDDDDDDEIDDDDDDERMWLMSSSQEACHSSKSGVSDLMHPHPGENKSYK